MGNYDGWNNPGDSIERAEMIFQDMLSHQQNGELVVIGTDRAFDPGTVMIRLRAGVAKIKRRATRTEFEDYAPNSALARAQHAPFYYVVELVLAGTPSSTVG